MLKSRVERLESACNGSKAAGKGYYEQRISAVEKTNEKITTILESLVKSIKQIGPDPEKTLGLAFSDKVDVNRDYQNNQNSMNTSDGEQDSSVIVLCCRNLGLKVRLLYGEMRINTDSKILVY